MVAKSFSTEKYFIFLKKEVFSEKKQRIFYPFLIQFAGHSELDCCSLIPSTRLEDLIQKFNLTKNTMAIFVSQPIIGRLN